MLPTKKRNRDHLESVYSVMLVWTAVEKLSKYEQQTAAFVAIMVTKTGWNNSIWYLILKRWILSDFLDIYWIANCISVSCRQNKEFKDFISSSSGFHLSETQINIFSPFCHHFVDQTTIWQVHWLHLLATGHATLWEKEGATDFSTDTFSGSVNSKCFGRNNWDWFSTESVAGVYLEDRDLMSMRERRVH